jgi:hypothetical protein
LQLLPTLCGHPLPVRIDFPRPALAEQQEELEANKVFASYVSPHLFCSRPIKSSVPWRMECSHAPLCTTMCRHNAHRIYYVLYRTSATEIARNAIASVLQENSKFETKPRGSNWGRLRPQPSFELRYLELTSFTNSSFVPARCPMIETCCATSNFSFCMFRYNVRMPAVGGSLGFAPASGGT